MGTIDLIDRIFLWIIPVIFAITLHEVAHGLSAYYLGDSTAKSLNRLSLNPIHHIDPVGSIAVPFILLTFSNFMFGWAKPVPIMFHNLNNPKRDMVLVAAAGPFSNLIMAIFWALSFKLGLSNIIQNAYINDVLVYSGAAGILINAALMMLNLLPLLPLDGGRILNGLLPTKLSYWHAKTERFGLPLLIILMVTGSMQGVMQTLINVSLASFSWLAQIPVAQLQYALAVMMGY